METQTINTPYIAANPYATNPTSIVELQLLLLIAVACAVVGFLLAEKNILERMSAGTDETMRQLVRPRVTETI